SLKKSGGEGGERVYAGAGGKSARTQYIVVDRTGAKVAWLMLKPETGRTHQLRVHLASIGAPILGDGKYGGKEAFLGGADGIGKKIHLHARSISIPGLNGKLIKATAPLPDHMAEAWIYFGFHQQAARDFYFDEEN
ncbi:MAG: RNA pseudouridine synthase, partial [Rhodospirillales bacterium]|nr:RNA pseudouridine synthase [Rhodospirillales bacterium]